MPQEDELTLQCVIRQYEGQPILHLEALEPDGTLSYKLSFGLNKAYSLVDAMPAVIAFAGTGELPEEAQGCELRGFKKHVVIKVPHDSQRDFTFGQRKAELVAHFAEAIQAFADTQGKSAGPDETIEEADDAE